MANDRSTVLWHNVCVPDEHLFALRQVDQARTDFALIEAELEAIHARLARMPTRKDPARTALGVIFCSAALVIARIEMFWRQCF